MLPIPRRLAILAFALAVLPLPIASIGCGGADQTDKTAVKPTEQVKQAENNMEDFMKGQDAAKKKK